MNDEERLIAMKGFSSQMQKEAAGEKMISSIGKKLLKGQSKLRGKAGSDQRKIYNHIGKHKSKYQALGAGAATGYVMNKIMD